MAHQPGAVAIGEVRAVDFHTPAAVVSAVDRDMRRVTTVAGCVFEKFVERSADGFLRHQALLDEFSQDGVVHTHVDPNRF